ncbi:M48 family metallopeptidase [Leptospira sp. 96542]|nr:M48 family metallopeptidase [Leptospira sp. 96542]
MLEQKEFSSRFYDGKSAVPEEGTVLVYGNAIQFKSNHTSHKLYLENFAEFTKTHNGCKLTLNPDEREESPVLEIFINDLDKKSLESLWIEHKKNTGGLNKLIFTIRSTNKFVLVAITICISASIGLGYYKSLEIIPSLLPISVDQSLGESVQKRVELQFDLCESKAAETFFNETLKTIVPANSNYKYKISLINRKDPNAFALSNGQIYVFSGLLHEAENQSEVIGVLAHEIAHVEKRHHIRNLVKALGTSFAISLLVGPGFGDFEIMETITELGSTIAVLKFSRDFETEADTTAVKILYNKNYSAKGLYSFFEKIHQLENSDEEESEQEENQKESVISKTITDYLSTHPATKDRMEALTKMIKEKPGMKKLVVPNVTWKAAQNSCI